MSIVYAYKKNENHRHQAFRPSEDLSTRNANCGHLAEGGAASEGTIVNALIMFFCALSILSPLMALLR